MNMEKGNVSIDAENIMPVIKRWLYSDKDIFLREVVSNACDAITKFRMLHPGTEEEMSVLVTVNKDAGEIRIDDTGIGMTADEVKKYINQVAFSSAAEFMKQFSEGEEKGDIIGHFGLGFYSVFMVSDKVEIDSLSHEEGAEPVHWVSEDGMSFEMGTGSRTTHGTTIILHVSEEEKEFLDLYKVREILKRYCGFMAYPISLFDACAKPVERKVPVGDEKNEDGSQKMETVMEDPKPEQINDTNPLWLRKPGDCKDEDYKKFYTQVFHDYNEPLFWIHLNVDYPLNLKGILYFPKLREDFGVRDGEIKLFSGQVFVADNIKEIIPEFLTLLKGVIDCPDIPLNVSRSFLQNDSYVKKISSHITKKVSDKLVSLFNNDRASYETYWNDIHPFVKYGCITEQKFYEGVKDVLLFKLTDGTFKTLTELKDRNAEKTDKKIFYTTDAQRQAGSIALYTQQGIDVAVMDFAPIDPHFLNFLEYNQGEDSVKFVRVDADLTGLTKESDEGSDLNAEDLQNMFRKAIGDENLEVKLESMANEDLISLVTEDEQMRRFRDMYRMKDMKARYTLVLNRRSTTVQALSKRDPEEELTQDICREIYDLACMAAQPLDADQITAFLTRSQKLVGLLLR